MDEMGPGGFKGSRQQRGVLGLVLGSGGEFDFTAPQRSLF